MGIDRFGYRETVNTVRIANDPLIPWAPSESIDALREYVREMRRECQDLPLGVTRALDMVVDELVRINDFCAETALRLS